MIGIASLSDVIKDDHRELEGLFAHIIDASDTNDQARYQDQFVRALAVHTISEELVVCPAFEEHVKGGNAIAEKDRQEHLEIKKRLYRFQSVAAGSEDFTHAARALMATLADHVREEERVDLIALEAGLQASESEALAEEFRRVKRLVPKGGHASAPDAGPLRSVAGLMAAPVDKLRDTLRMFPQEGAGAGVRV